MVKQFLTSGLVMLAAFSLHAFDNDYKCYSLDANGNKTYWSLDGQKTGFIKNAVKTPYKQPSKQINIGDPKLLDIEIRYDENLYSIECIAGGQFNNGNFLIDRPEKDLGIQEIPNGVAGLMCIFKKANTEVGSTDYYVVAKNIKDTPNQSKLVFDIEECIHKISYEPLGIDGKPISISKLKGNEVVEEGEYGRCFSNITWSHVIDGTTYVLQYPYQPYIAADGTEKYSRPGDIYFNDCGPDFTMGHYLIASSSVNPCDFTVIELPVYRGEISASNSHITLSNDPSRFKTYTQKWTRSPYSVATYNEMPFGMCVFIESADVAINGFGSESMYPCTDTDIETHTIVCSNDPNSENSNLMSMLLIENIPENDFQHTDGLCSMWWKDSNEGRSYKPNNFTGNQGINCPYNTYYNFVEGNYSPWLATYDAHNPHLAFKDNQTEGRLGNNCPIISLMPDPQPYASDFLPFYYGLVGRYGEGNYIGAMTLIEENNTFEYDTDGFRKDEFIYENILIDGEIDGCVKAELTIKKGGVDDDYIPPVLTFLVTRNKDNIYTDRFNSASDGVIEFYAADFYNDLDWSLGEYGFLEYKCKPIPSDKLKVEYAPYSSDNFKPLFVSEVPEKYFYPGWGNYYTVPLDEVTGNSVNGWFDIRITMEDAEGNRHVQTISPAFKLLDSNGIETISDDNIFDTSVFYDLSGRRIDSPDKGFYIECHGNKTRKIMK